MSLKVAVTVNTLKLVLSFLLEKAKEVSELLCVYICLPSSVFKHSFAFFHELCAAYVHAFRVYLLKLSFF